MPYKHQTASYRNKGGKRYFCWADVFTAEERLAAIAEAKQQYEGCHVFAEKHTDGYWRVFVEVKK